MKRKFLFAFLAVAAPLFHAVAEPSSESPPGETLAPPARYQDWPYLLMAKEREDKLRRNMPAGDWAGIYYTNLEMPPAHQSGDNDGFHLNGHNYSVNKSDPGNGHSDEAPWKHPGGCDHCQIYTWKILQLPPGGKVRSFTSNWFFHVNSSNGGGYYTNGRDWTFPVGTRLVEAFSFADELLVFEVRMREKVGVGAWKTHRLFPWASAEEYVEAGGRLLKSERRTLRDPHPTPAFQPISTIVDTVDGEQRRLLYGAEFKESRWAPSTDGTSGIVPKGYVGAFTVRDCRNCHADAAQHVNKFQLGREWYGRVRGSLTDKILSFHPVDPASMATDASNLTPRLNPKLRPIVQWEK